MNAIQKREDVLMKVRNKLNIDGIKLWIQPYFIEGSGRCDEQLEGLAVNLSKELKLDSSSIIPVLQDLQANALEKIAAREKFQKTGVATLKVRVSANHREAAFVQTVEIPLSENGLALKVALAEKLNIDPVWLKLISSGQVIKDELLLSSQSIRNGMQLMALQLDGSQSDFQDEEKRQRHLNSIKADAQLLACRRNDHNVSYLQVADQSGKVLNLPKEEAQALSVAMALNEKGRAALKSEDYSLALLFFLEAEKEFNQCNSNLLKSVDNYALLNLDIVWCYLCLRSVSHLPDAEQRLKKCEENFHNSYGTNLERLITLKGTTGNERALFFRLHLLQAIVSYHLGKSDAAKRLIQRAENEYKLLAVDDASLSQVLELGYTPPEARLALRATHGNVEEAVAIIEQKRREKAELRRKESFERKLGLCKDGRQFVDVKAYSLLTDSMGFAPQMAAAALRLSNNATPLAIQMLQEQEAVVLEEAERFNLTNSDKKALIKQMMIVQVIPTKGQVHGKGNARRKMMPLED
ncbi:NEDD8 ultimate buster 1-like isoform X2 [Ischnura elegans]|uniref:NEDD8 ultimate buster 1-like isoform X2 n=1 Tax=Ischnura elegans TaxID=197161 RepID=UPI001ED87F9F|nr:NEDD8 ultimate buster 1-like isoform X2 [Ischnura elegans]XP_046393503.1 NEDD8 ultimate buster 1-like isoform X2 [Ischnura elegans]